MNAIDKPVQRLLETYRTAVRSKNVEAFMQLYDTDVRVFDTWGMWSYEGAASWRVAIEGWFSSLGSEVCVVTFDDVQIVDGRELGSVSAVVTYAAVSAEGEPLREMQNRITWVVKISGHVWRVVHEHTSAPVGFDDAKAILKRDGMS